MKNKGRKLDFISGGLISNKNRFDANNRVLRIISIVVIVEIGFKIERKQESWH